jgi:hypothetical protein
VGVLYLMLVIYSLPLVISYERASWLHPIIGDGSGSAVDSGTVVYFCMGYVRVEEFF